MKRQPKIVRKLKATYTSGTFTPKRIKVERLLLVDGGTHTPLVFNFFLSSSFAGNYKTGLSC